MKLEYLHLYQIKKGRHHKNLMITVNTETNCSVRALIWLSQLN